MSPVAVIVVLHFDDMPFFAWLFYEGVILGKFYGPCIWPDDFMDHPNATRMYNLEYDEDLGCYPKQSSRDLPD